MPTEYGTCWPPTPRHISRILDGPLTGKRSHARKWRQYQRELRKWRRSLVRGNDQ